MKTPYFIITFFVITALSCKKQPIEQLSLLPPATQTGTNTFGCLVNGAAFKPQKKTSVILEPDLICFYSNSQHGYVFRISASRDMGNGSADNVGMSTDSLKISEGETLRLTKAFSPGQAFGAYGGNLLSYTTNANTTGQLTITHLDTIKHIVSGTFRFNAAGGRGDTVKVTNGRFDVHYIQ